MNNVDQIDYWNGKAGVTWVAMQQRMDRALTPVTAALLAAAVPAEGDDILDVGCGAGETSLALAAAVGPDGFVTGVDVSTPLIAAAQARAETHGLDIEFVEADAACFAEGGRDLIVSRFGVMFFADPVAAFANLHKLAVPGGRLAFACWQPPGENLWATLPVTLLADAMPADPRANPYAPGPFAFADAARTTTILAEAGWRDIVSKPLAFAMVMGSGSDPVDDAVDFSLRIGPAARAVQDAGPDVLALAQTRFPKAFAAHLHDGVVAMAAGIWLFTANA